MSGSGTWWKRSLAAIALIGALPVAIAAPAARAAATTTVALWSMDEPAGSTILADSSGAARNGTIGLDVQLGVQVDGATAHRYPPVPTAAPPTHPEHLDRVPSSAVLNPDTSDYAVTVRYRTTENFGNIVQKGQNASPGGYWKFEAPNGVVTCLFKSDTGQRAVGSVNPLNDGRWHTVRCELTSTSLTMYVDGVRVSRLAGNPGRIANSKEITIAGKGVCDQIEVTCDYFVGDIDYVRIEKGSGGPANAAPTASLEPSCVGLICSFSAAASGDVDGAIQRYAWDFGDGGTGQYARATHSYAAAGTYTVSLTVTDDRGATATTTEQVTVAPVPEVISFVGRSSASANATSHVVRVPAGVTAGDGLLMFLANNNAAAVAQIAGVTGWIPLDSVSGGYATTRVWRKVAGASDGGAEIRITMSQQTKANLVVLAYDGTSPGDPVAAWARVADTVSSAVRTTPTAEVADGSSWAVSYWMHGDSSSTALVPPAGVTARASGTQSGGGRVTTLVADSDASVPPGGYGGLSVTAPTASTTSSAWTIVLAPDRGPVENQPPTAELTSSCTDLTCTFDASASTDRDGVIAARTWDLGDGASAAGPTAAHTYGAAGTYTVTFTATDDDGAAASAVRTVTVPRIAPVDVIRFVGGATQSVTAAGLAVTVPVAVQPGDGLVLLLAVNTTTTVSAPTGAGWQSLGIVTSGTQRSRAWRKVAASGDAGSTVSLTFGASAKAAAHLLAYRGTSTTDPVAVFQSLALTENRAARPTPTAAVPGEQSWAISFWAHLDSITGALTPPAGVTTRGSGTQSSSNRVTTLVADSAGLVPSGSYGGLTATATAASTTATTMTIVLAPSDQPPANSRPSAVFSTSCNGRTCSFDGRGSTDVDGSIQGYAWDFGDGTQGAGPTPSHTFGADGTYTVTLTATDDAGAVGTSAASVTVPVVVPVPDIAFVGQASSNANASTHAVVVPAAVRAGDGLLLFFADNNSATITDPAGWTVLDTIVNGGTTTRVWTRTASDSDAGARVAVVLSAGSKAGLTLVAYRGTSAAGPVAGFARTPSTSGATRTTPTVAVDGSRSWVVSYWSHRDSSTDALVAPDGVAVRASGSQTSSGRVTTLVADSGSVAPAGAYGGLAATAAAASSVGSAWTIVLAPAG